MTAQAPESTVIEGVRSLEARWIFPGQLETAVARWFGRFPAGTESREDTYLLDPRWRGLSMKVRGGGALEVKAYRGSPGILEVAGRARGRLESWQKWSFPFSPPRQDSACPPGWRPVRKRRRVSRFWLASGRWRCHGQAGGLPAGEWTLASILKQAGYSTCQIGKWHLGEADYSMPTAHGFDEMHNTTLYHLNAYTYTDPAYNPNFPFDDKKMMATWGNITGRPPAVSN